MASRGDYYEDLIRNVEDDGSTLEAMFVALARDFDARITTVEESAGGLAEIREQLIAQGDELISSTIDPLIERVRGAAELGVLLTASSISLVSVGTGVRSFTVNEADRPTFAPPAMLAIAATDVPTVAMYARKIAYDRTTGTLLVDVIGTQGAGNYSSWTITTGSMVANANVMAIAPIDGLAAGTVQAAIAALALMASTAATTGQLNALRSEILGGVGPAFDTLVELAAALGNNPNLAAEVSTALACRLRFDQAQALTDPQKAIALANLGTDKVYARVDGSNAGPLGGYRNRAVNPGFSVKQRRPAGTAINVGTGGYILCDRWRMRPQSETGGNVQVSTSTSSSDIYSKFGGDYLRINRTALLTAPFQTSQRFEDVRAYAACKFTVAIAAQDDAGGSATVYCRQFFGSGGSPAVTVSLNTGALPSVGSALGIVPLTFDLPSIDGKTLGDGHFFEVYVQFNTLTVGNSRLAFVQPQFGENFTGPELRPRSIEELLAKWYFERLVGAFSFAGFAQSATTAQFAATFLPKRAAPACSAVFSDARVRDRSVSASSPAATDMGFFVPNPLGNVNFTATVASGLTTGAGCLFQAGANSYIDLDSEL